jgi:hypothetical protein
MIVAYNGRTPRSTNNSIITINTIDENYDCKREYKNVLKFSYIDKLDNLL